MVKMIVHWSKQVPKNFWKCLIGPESSFITKESEHYNKGAHQVSKDQNEGKEELRARKCIW